MTTYMDVEGKLASDPDDVSTNTSGGDHFDDVVDRRASRRSILLGGGLTLAAGFLTSSIAQAPAAAANPGSTGRLAPPTARNLLGFEPIALSYADEIQVPPGYTAVAFIPWGTPITGSMPAFRPGANTAAEQEQQIGMHHDGMHFFPARKGPAGSKHGLIAVNHEYTAEDYLHSGVKDQFPARGDYTAEMVKKSQAAHGVAVVEVRQRAGSNWEVVPGRYNRRITAYTPMTVSGPAAGNANVRTSADPSGTRVLGTFNNCAHGVTPWDTYLTCEENFNGYFRVDNLAGMTADQQANISRYGVGGDRNNWSTHDERFVLSPQEPNEANRHGWVVEIDPFDPNSTPVKRTSLGRIKHESAHVVTGKGGRVVVYTGDDQVNEHMYKFVSSANWNSLRARGRSPLDEGTLYAAKYNDDGTGQWLPLVHGQNGLIAANGFTNQGDVLVKTRLAASMVGATRMDRPEWVTSDPNTGMVYLTLTNNTSGSKVENAANPRTPNPYGHIIRWKESENDHTALTFEWDLFLLAGQGRESGDGSTIGAEDAFSSPDGIWSDDDGRVWIQTDAGGRQLYDANDMMLAANPYVADAHGAPEIKRFFNGVRGCEVTGVINTPDNRTMFVNIQHPGEFEASTWPHNDQFDTPRSATVVVTKDDGGTIGT